MIITFFEKYSENFSQPNSNLQVLNLVGRHLEMAQCVLYMLHSWSDIQTFRHLRMFKIFLQRHSTPCQHNSKADITFTSLWSLNFDKTIVIQSYISNWELKAKSRCVTIYERKLLSEAFSSVAAEHFQNQIIQRRFWPLGHPLPLKFTITQPNASKTIKCQSLKILTLEVLNHYDISSKHSSRTIFMTHI